MDDLALQEVQQVEHWFGRTIFTPARERIDPKEQYIFRSDDGTSINPAFSHLDTEFIKQLLMTKLFQGTADHNNLRQTHCGTMDPRVGQLIYMNSPDILNLFLEQFPETSKNSFLYSTNQDGIEVRYNFTRANLASGFGLPVFADFRATVDLLTTVRYLPRIAYCEGNMFQLDELHGFETYKYSGIQVELFDVEGNTGYLVYKMPWSRLSDTSFEKVMDGIKQKFGDYNLLLPYSQSDLCLSARIMGDKYNLDVESLSVASAYGFLNELSELAGMPIFASKNAMDRLCQIPAEELPQRYGLVHSFITDASNSVLTNSGHSEAEVNAVLIKDVIYRPANTSEGEIQVLHELSARLFVEKKTYGEREHTLSAFTEYQMLQWCKVAGLNVPEVRLINERLYVEFIDGNDLSKVLEDPGLSVKDTYSLFTSIKGLIDSMHSALGEAESKHAEFSETTLSEIKDLYQSEWKSLLKKCMISGDQLECSIAIIDGYFESIGMKKQVLADFSPNNVKLDENGNMTKFDMNYPSYDFRPMDYAVAIFYNPKFSQDNIDSAIDSIMEGMSQDEKVLTQYSFLKKNLYGHLFFLGKDDVKSNHRLNSAVENYKTLCKMVEGEPSYDQLSSELSDLGKQLTMLKEHYLHVSS